jgi:hypothetical protein
MRSHRRGILVGRWVFLAAAAGGVLAWYASLASSQTTATNPHVRLAAESSHATNLDFIELTQSTARDVISSNGGFSVSTRALLAAEVTDPPPSSPIKAPSVLEMLEGREPDMVLWLAIAVAFFFLGWIVGAIYARRRERSRRSRLRF